MDHRGLRHFIHYSMSFLLAAGLAIAPISVLASPDSEKAASNAMKLGEISTPQIKDALKDCVDKEGSSASACNEDSSPFAQAAMGALSALMPMLMQNQGQKQDCNKVDAAQAAASQQMGQGMPGCGGGQPPGGGDKGGGDKGGGGNNMAKDCGSKTGEGKKSCAEAKKKIAALKKTPECQKKPNCVADAEKGEQIAGESEKANEKMGSVNIGQIMQMLGQMLCQMKKAQECQKDVCSAPGQLKFDAADPKMTSAVPGQSKVLQDDEGCMVDCNNLNFVSDPQYPQWAAKVNARITKFKPQCECLKTPSLPGCGSITSPTAGAGTPKKDKKQAALSDESGEGNANDKTLGSMDTPTPGGGGGVGAMGGGSGVGGGGKGADGKKDPARLGAPPGPPQVSAGYEGGGGSPSKSGGSGNDDPIGKYSKFLPGRKPNATPDAGLQITGAGGKSIWEKVSDAYRIKAGSLSR